MGTGIMKKILAVTLAAALTISLLPAGGFVVYGEEQAEEGEISVDALRGNAAGDLLWNTGVAAVGQFVPYGTALAPILNAFGTLLGVGVDNQPSPDDLIKQLKDVCKQIRELDNSVSKFREEMDTRLNKFEREMSDEIEAALNEIKNDIFVNGVGAELDTLHTQVRGRSGIAKKIKAINSDDSMSDEVKAIETAYLIGNDKDWNETKNVIYRFKIVGDLLAGKRTYRDTNGRNLYQVLYDEAARNSMMSGEAYKTMEPYIDRVMDEYLYAYTVLTQCLTASLEVSLLTDEEVEKLQEGDNGEVEYERYLECQVITDLVKKELDNINSQFLNAKDPNSIISLYSAFKNKKENNATVYINKGTAAVSLCADIDSIKNQWTGKRLHDDTMNEGHYSEYQSDWYSDEKYRDYYQGVSDFVSGGEHLDPESIRNISEHLQNASPGVSLLEYLDESGFNTSKYTGDAFCFATSEMKTKMGKDTNVYSCEYGFDTVDASKTSGESTWVAPCNLSVERSGIGVDEEQLEQESVLTVGEAEEESDAGGDDWYVYATLGDVSYLGLRIEDSEEMPETAEEVMEKYSDYTAGPLEDGSNFELYQKYDIREIPISFKDADRKTVSYDELSAYPDGSRLRLSISGALGKVLTDGTSLIFKEAGEYEAFVSALDPSGRSFVSEGLVLKCVPEHKSSSLSAKQTLDASDAVILTLGADGVIDLNKKIGPGFNLAGQAATSVIPVWEAKEMPDDGIELDASGIAVFNRKGIFHVRFKGMDENGDYAYGPWNEIVVRDPEEYFTMTFHDAAGNEMYRITKKEGAAIGGVEGGTNYGYSFAGWDLIEEDGRPDGEAEEVPAYMPGEDTKYTALWKREIFGGYEAVSNEEELLSAIASASSLDPTYIALADDITVKKLEFPKVSGANIFIDGVEHTLAFQGNAVISPKAGQSLSFEDITLKAGKGGSVKITAESGGILLDNTSFDCKQANITAVKGELYLNDIKASNLTVKGGSKQSVTVGGESKIKEITGFNKIYVEDNFSIIKTLKAREMQLEGDAVFNVNTGAAVNLAKGISGWGEIYLAKDFKPLSLGTNNSGKIRLTSYESLEHKVVFKTKAANLNEVFDVSDLAPQVTNGDYVYGLYVKSGNAYICAYTLKLNGKTYCEWNDCIKAVALVKPVSDATITLLSDVDLPGTLKLPTKGKYKTLTINGNGYALTFSGKNAALTGDLVLKNLSIRSTSGAWILNKGKYILERDGVRLTGCTIR